MIASFGDRLSLQERNINILMLTFPSQETTTHDSTRNPKISLLFFKDFLKSKGCFKNDSKMSLKWR